MIVWQYRIMNLMMIVFLYHLAGCTTPQIQSPGPDVAPYSSQPSEGGLVRKQNGENVPYKDSKGWLCHPPEKYEELLNWCVNTSPPSEPGKQ